jgi:hypothetical protein
MSHLSPTHHETNKYDSTHEQIRVGQLKLPKFKFKPQQVNDSLQSNQGTDHLISQNPNTILNTKNPKAKVNPNNILNKNPNTILNKYPNITPHVTETLSHSLIHN